MKKIISIGIILLFLLTGLTSVISTETNEEKDETLGCYIVPTPKKYEFTIAFEDLKDNDKSYNDWDYNDFIAEFSIKAEGICFAHHLKPRTITIDITPVAKIAGYDHRFYIRLPPSPHVEFQISHDDVTGSWETLADYNGHILIYKSTEDAVENNEKATITLRRINNIIDHSDPWIVSLLHLTPRLLCHQYPHMMWFTGKRLFQPYINVSNSYTVPSEINDDASYEPFLQYNSPDIRVLYIKGHDWVHPNEGQSICSIYDTIFDCSSGKPQFL